MIKISTTSTIGRVLYKIKGFYYIENEEKNIFECKLKGINKRINRKDNCVVGDIVEFDPREKIINKILERKNILKRPLVANIDLLGIVFSIKSPNFDMERFNLLLLDCFYYNVKPFVIINKIDLVNNKELKIFKNSLSFLKNLNIDVFYISTITENIDTIKEYTKNKVTAFGGPSGVGKSTIINLLQNEKELETGEISKKLSRGRHTTKGATILHLNYGGYIIDTPGFSSLELPNIRNEKELLELFSEFYEYSINCKFNNCLHINEPNCYIKDLVEKNKLSKIRYDFYIKTYNTLKNERWNKYD
ncbi:ribosome biogenesis GTPase [Hypnocyclicus thermotrophus]|uniref:Small ribosomal subunit biogenesis GTPase RsgA n=1 Tax=Hypnocyclicus thermotrophus TaxID=1627895 RepID=A0AA46DXV3_9FUSO|nr:ribosome small subunit-dependent GTPase A [Hypnocyclicus thermotrophus]TDT68531.1 ribosome biogenesis GTPase [Hypnocyclicus thermotrophus]